MKTRDYLTGSLLAALLIVGVWGYTSTHGAVFGSRIHIYLHGLDVTEVRVQSDGVAVSVRNNELRPVSAKVWYVASGLSGQVSTYTSPPAVVNDLPPLTTWIVLLPLPAQPAYSGGTLRGFAAETLKYGADDHIVQSSLAETIILQSGAPMVINAAELHSDGVTAQLTFRHSGSDTEVFRYALSLVNEDTQETVYLSSFSPITLIAEETRPVPFTAAVPLAAKTRYRLILWVQRQEIVDGTPDFFQYSQYVYPQLLETP